MRSLVWMAVLLPVLAAGCQYEEEATETGEAEEDFDGVYEFVRLDTPEGENMDQRGHMIVYQDYVCHVRASKEREAISQEDAEDLRQSKAAELYSASTSACGRYSLEGDRLTVDWMTSSSPSVEGNATEFILTHEGETVRLAPAASPEFIFVYRRIPSGEQG